MFEFLNHKNVAKEADKETLTTNSSETTDNLSTETESDSGLELFYKTAEYEEAKSAYDIVGQEDFLKEVKKQLTEGVDYEDIRDLSVETDTEAENGVVITEVQPEALVSSMPVEQVADVDLSQEDEKTLSAQGFVRIGKILAPAAAALTLAFAACNDSDKYPRYRPDVVEKEKAEDGAVAEQKVLPKVEATPAPVPTQTTPAQTAEKPTETNPAEVKPVEVQPGEVKPEPQSEEPIPPPAPVVEKVPGKTMESTLPTRRGVEEALLRFHLEEILPSGDLAHGYLKLSDTTADAVASGALKPNLKFGVYSLEVTKDPARQGIPFKSIWILKLSEGKLPKPLMKEASFTNYISKTQNGVFHITNEHLAKYKIDLQKNIRAASMDRAGKFDKKVYERMMEETPGFAADELNTVLKWLNANEAEKSALVDKWVKPFENRTGTINDKK